MIANSGDNGKGNFFPAVLVHDSFQEVNSTHISGSAMSNNIAYLKAVVAEDNVDVYNVLV